MTDLLLKNFKVDVKLLDVVTHVLHDVLYHFVVHLHFTNRPYVHGGMNGSDSEAHTGSYHIYLTVFPSKMCVFVLS